MPTKLKKKVARETEDKVMFKNVNLIIELVPPNIISIREKRKQGSYEITIGGLYGKLMGIEADKILNEKKSTRKKSVKRGLLSLGR